MAFPERDHAPHPRPAKISYENRTFLMVLAAGLLPSGIAFLLLRDRSFSDSWYWTVAILSVSLCAGMAAAVRSTIVRSLRTLASMQAAVREGDFSIRARSTGVNDSLSEVIYEINELASTLQNQRLGAFEAGALMRKVLTEIQAAVFAFDAEHRLRLLNREAERLIGQVGERALGSSAEKLGIADLLQGREAHTAERSFPGGGGRWGIRRTTFRQGGTPHQLVVVTDLSRALREEERQAWQRLVRVLGHELNNSLAPIKSISQSLQTLFRREPRPQDWEDDMGLGLQVIADRSEALARFMADYSRLARLPKPNLHPVAIAPLLRRVAHLDSRLPVKVEEGPDATLDADSDQLEQLFINLLRNGVDASLQTGSEVTLHWEVNGSNVRVRILD
nr:PAS domain-containing sensor histidine kinase [Terriglobales bacterium]